MKDRNFSMDQKDCPKFVSDVRRGPWVIEAPKPEVPLGLAPSLFIRVVKVNMQGCKPLSLEAQGRLTDWIFSKKQSTPGFLGSLAFLNPDLLRIWQVKNLFHFLPPSPGVSPSVPPTVVDDLVSHREGVDQMGRDVRRVIQTVTEASMNDAPTRQTVPQRILEDAIETQEQSRSGGR
jgi:hypothetical protein